MKTRNEIFQRLKPICIPLNQAVLSRSRSDGPKANITASLDTLYDVLSQEAIPDSDFDKNLADYVFFPLSHLFRPNQGLPERATVRALQCLALLLKSGWRSGLPHSLGRQILILLTLLIGQGKGKSPLAERSEELQEVTYSCMQGLFEAYNNASQSESLTETAMVPHILEAVTLMLAGITDTSSREVQLEAVSAYGCFHTCIKDREVIASFFPGTVSSLTKATTSVSSVKNSSKVSRACLELMTKVTHSLLNDLEAQSISDANKETDESPVQGRVYLTESWLKATSGQVKVALANVFRLQYDSRVSIRNALCSMCTVIIEHCSKTLSDAVPLCVDTLVSLLSQETSMTGPSLQRLAMSNTAVVECLQTSLRAWVTSLPRVAQSNDDRAKERLLRQISITSAVLSDLDRSSSLVDDVFARNLRDGVVVAISRNIKRPLELNTTDGTTGLSSALTSHFSKSAASLKFSPILTGAAATLTPLSFLLKDVALSSSAESIIRNSLEYVRNASGDALVASVWLSLQLIRSAVAPQDRDEEYLNFPAVSNFEPEEGLEELYTYSLSLLSSSSPTALEEDWRLQALALEVIALQAQQLREEFRIELVDAIYPIVHYISSPILVLREHAVVCLNIVASATGFSSAGELILGNVDYLVNSISLKLNTFDISPQAPQALLMMIKLSGPSLIPYLEDLVHSIFAALDSFHGYPRLVELLFSVLYGIVEESAKPEAQLSITSQSTSPNHSKTAKQPLSIDDVLGNIRSRKAETNMADSRFVESVEAKDPFPQKPWKELGENAPKEGDSHFESTMDELTLRDNASHTASEEPPAPSDTSDALLPQTKTYQTLRSICVLTQHYLPHSSSKLRVSLCALIDISIPPLATNEDAFLPVVNEIWPPLCLRLHDSEPFVVASAARAVASMCEMAGDFMARRVASRWDQWRAAFKKWEVEAGLEGLKHTEKASMPSSTLDSGSVWKLAPSGAKWHSQSRQTFTSYIHLFATVVGHVRLEDRIKDEILDLAAPYFKAESSKILGRLDSELQLEVRSLRDVLEIWNEDAVWWVLEGKQLQQ